MEREEAAPAPASLYGDGGPGAGGKFRRRPYRRPPATPYDRPPLPPATGERRDGWLSKLANGATRFLPSLFTKALTHPPPQSDQKMVREASYELPNGSSDNQISESMELGGSSNTGKELGGSSDTEKELGGSSDAEKELGGSSDEDRSKSGRDNDEPAGDKSVDDSGLAPIEQLLKQKTFSRDEFDRLMGILRSRTSEVSDVDMPGNRNPNMVAVAEAAKEELRKSVEVRQACKLENQVIGRIPKPPVQSNMYDEVGSSPVEIAKAFMGARTSALSLNSQSPTLKDKRFPPCSDDFASASIPSPVLKSPTCWPGAMVQDAPGFLTPQTQRGRTEIHNFPRTPYHGAVHSRSISKSGGERSVNLSSMRRRQPYTPVFGGSQVTKRNSISDDGFGTVGPIRRLRQKTMESTISKGASSSRPGSSSLLQPSSSNAFMGFLSSAQEMEPGTSKSSLEKFHHVDNKTIRYVGSSTVHPQSSEMARRILEHLDRTVPSPKEKAAEIKLAVERNRPSPEITADMSNGQLGRFDVGPDSQSSSLLVRDPSSQRYGERGKDLFHNQVENKKADEAVHSMNASVLASNMFSKTQEMKVCAEPLESKNSRKNRLWPLHNQTGEQGISGLGGAAGPIALQMQQPLSSGSKPALTSISITKPNGKHAISTDNYSGFTFPVSGAFTAPSEPPTPTIGPFFTSRVPPPEEENAVPSFKFGSSTAAARGPVFSFAPTASTGVADASSIPKFDFGSDKKSRVSFRPVGKDAICY
ncbi:nuclear pore complex protein NUP1 isoform X3 [Magnolia sinica]|uniref:nuclear pore complex protein NUP1 isoform X3 n=1 Tax=Magnolia sinica TaxID=86752 RepID=UPI00265A7F16|nr:nuclear pore complex protein NUP1 isoform X3 [Magnolia sinica]